MHNSKLKRKNTQNIPYLIHIRVLIKLININMYLKVFYFSFINLLVALAVNTANASPGKKWYMKL